MASLYQKGAVAQGFATQLRRGIDIERDSNGLLLVREENKGGGVTLPFLCLGFADYMSHQGERAMFATDGDPLAAA